RPEQEHAVAVEQAGRDRELDRGVGHRRRPQRGPSDRPAEPGEPAGLVVLYDLERVEDVAEHPAGPALFQLDPEPEAAARAAQHPHAVAALGPIEPPEGPPRPRHALGLLAEDPGVVLAHGERRPQEEDGEADHQRPPRRGGGGHGMNQSRNRASSGLPGANRSSPPWGSMPLSGLVNRALFSGEPQSRKRVAMS